VKSEKLKSGKKELSGSEFFLDVTRHSLLISYILLFALCASVHADIKDRVVAFVDNDAITLSELEAKYAETLKVTPAITKEEVLTTMVNSLLLLNEARKMKLEAPTEDALLREYIDLKIRSFIRIKEEEITDFYKKHINEFQGKELDDVRDGIEKYLTEKEVNERLKAHIDELRGKSCVRMQLSETSGDESPAR
jgi:hypothetical protein